jgi:hypothetical protein
MQFLVPAGIAALSALPVILFLYFLKVKRPEVRVATLRFWRPYLADVQANAPWQRLRWSLLLLVQLAAALALALALTRPGLVGVAGVGKTTVVLVDGSASMRATDVQPNRFEFAVSRAKEMADQLGPGQDMAVVLLGDHAQLLSPPTSDSGALRSALDRARPGGGAADLGEGLSIANAILAGRSGGSIVLLSDGHARPPPTLPRLNAPLVFKQIGTSGENCAIAAINLTGDGRVFLRVANYGRGARDLKIEIRVDGRLADILPVHVDGNSMVPMTWSGLPSRSPNQGPQIVEAKITPGDYFSYDDQAWLVAGSPPPHSVLLVTPENGYVRRALELRDGTKVTEVKPADYKPGNYDLYVFDSFVPPGKLPTPALVVAPPEGLGPVPAGPQIEPGSVLPGDPRDPLLRDLVLKDVHVEVAAKVAASAGWRTVISAVDTPLLLVHDSEPRMAEMTFELHHSDLPLRAAFPLLVQNLLDYLLPSGFENQTFPPGRPISLIAQPNAKWVEVTTPDGHTQRVGPPFPVPPLTDTYQVGVYTVRQQLPDGVRVSHFVVQFEDANQSRIAPGAAPLFDATGSQAARVPRGTLEVWPWLAVAALVLLVGEWFLFLRPTTPIRWRRGGGGGFRLPSLRWRRAS